MTTATTQAIVEVRAAMEIWVATGKNPNHPVDLALILAGWDAMEKRNQELAGIAQRYVAAIDFMLKDLDIDLDETEFSVKANGKHLITINVGDIRTELRAAIQSNTKG